MDQKNDSTSQRRWSYVSRKWLDVAKQIRKVDAQHNHKDENLISGEKMDFCRVGTMGCWNNGMFS